MAYDAAVFGRREFHNDNAAIVTGVRTQRRSLLTEAENRSVADNPLRRALAILRREGVRSCAVRLQSALGWRRLTLFVSDVGDPQPVAESDGSLKTIEHLEKQENLEIVEVVESGMERYLSLRPEQDPDLVRRRFRSGQRCIAVIRDDRVVGASWMATGPVEVAFLHAMLQVSPGTISIHDTFVDPRYRGHGISPALTEAIRRIAGQTGGHTLLRGVFPANRPAMRANAKSGFKPAGEIGSIRIGSWQRCYARTKLPLRICPLA
jgi:GNAT superfamily N-acetyltransferase